MDSPGPGFTGLHGKNHGCRAGDRIASGKDTLPGGFSILTFCQNTLAAVGFQSFGGGGDQRVGEKSKDYPFFLCMVDFLCLGGCERKV